MALLTHLICDLKETCSGLTDPRSYSPNLHYSLTDIVLSGFSVFFTQSPSFLDYQKTMERTYGTSNGHSLFGLTKIPSDNHIRDILDTIAPSSLFGQFRSCFERLENHPSFDRFCVLDNKILIGLDGTQHHSSTKIHCEHCSHKTNSKGAVTYSHQFVGATLCAPDSPHVLSLEPEFITPQDGHDKQDCETAAAKRWIDQHGAYYAQKSAVILGDDLYAHQPMCEKILSHKLNFILVCKPDSHKALYDFIQGAELTSAVHKGDRGKITHIRSITDVPINGSSKTITVNWVEIEEKDHQGKTCYRNAFITNLDVSTQKNALEIAQCGRARWKVENECFNTLKTKGYHLEHNFGHGKIYLSNTLATMNLLAFCFHTLSDLMDQVYEKINGLIKSRKVFFEEIRTITKYMVFDSWDHLFQVMLGSFKARDPTSKKR